jgi:serine/threonine protein phosphatase 1
MRKLLIGDVHGSYDQFMEALTKADFDVTKDKLIFIGDLFDKNKQTIEIIEYLCDLVHIYNNHPIWIYGNHDLWLLEYFQSGTVNPLWIKNGGESTLLDIREYEKNPNNVLNEFKQILYAGYYYYVDDDENLFVHGGITANTVGNEWRDDVYCWDRSLWKKALLYDALSEYNKKRPEFMNNYNFIFIGHSPVIYHGKSTPMICGNVVNVDTGAGCYGVLTIMDIKTFRYWQSGTLKV